jgi:predicted ABC-type ATPase
MLHRINELISKKENFSFETTLATKSYENKIIEAREHGYKISLLFFWLRTIELAKERVKTRVSEGGHNFPEEVIERLYKRGIENLFDIYLPIVDEAFIFDNSDVKHELLAEKQHNSLLIIINSNKFNTLKNSYVNNK